VSGRYIHGTNSIHEWARCTRTRIKEIQFL
jgi:hypothetical protein